MNALSSQPESDDRWLRDSFDQYSMYRDKDLRDEIAEHTSWLATRGAGGLPIAASRSTIWCRWRGSACSNDRPVRSSARRSVRRCMHSDHHGRATALLPRPHMGHPRSRRAKDLRPAVNSAIEALQKELQRSPRISEIAERMKIPEEAVIEALEANNAYRARHA